ncbi:uncharacterized protein PFB0145c-like isoform X2 [Nilaparvata lugens]|uniref:uncharacterized protein PFB0145c-like isoform X2 n=1 Tax=Nilaparvata lugens TaxID=108931 RepID=UPI00193D7F55|nr:uncharacterized protein PFB0145c-like isoform X2 [Nilaparvata lugens]
MSENRKSPLTQTIVSKSSKKSVNVDRKPESDSSSDESLEENEGVSQTRFMDSSMTVGESFKHTGVSTDFDSTFYEKLEKEGKRKERPSDETNSSDTPENLDSDEKIERINNKSPKNVKSPVKDVKTPKTSLTPRRDSVNSIPALKVDESFEKRRKMFLENTKSPEKRRDVSIVTETPEKLDSNEKLGRLESVGGLNTSKNDVATASSDHGKSKRKSNEKERQKLMTDDSEKGEAQNMLPDETDSRIRTIIDERSNASTKFTSNLSSIKSRHSVPGFNLDDETPKRTRRDSEKHDDDDRRRVSGSRIMEVQSANIVSVHKAHDSLERNSMSKEGNQVDCGRKDSIKVSDGVNVRVGSPEKAIRERAASICEESTATMLLKDAFSKFWGSKNRKSSGAKVVDSVDASTVEDSNQDTDLDQTSKKSGKVKRKSIEAIVKPAENLVKDDFGKETDMKKNIENSTRKSLEKKRKSLDGNVKSAENEAKTVNVKTSSEDENLDELIRKIEDAKRKSLDRNVSTVEERVPENASTLKDTNQNADSDRIAIKMKKKKSKERELDKRKSIEEEVGIEENLKQENRDCSLINSYQDTDVERLSKMGKKKKKHKDRDFEDRESEDILLNENMNLSLQNSKEEVDLEKVSKKPKKKKELDVGKAEELCATEECVEQEIVNRDSSVQDSNQERDMIKRVKKKKKHKENEKTERVLEPFTTENVEVKQEFKNNDLPVIDIVSSEMNLEKLSEKMKKKTKKLKQEREDEGENQEDIRTKWLAVDSNQCPVVEKLSKSKKKSRKKQKELEDLNKSSILLDSNNESGVQEMPKKDKKKNKKKPKEMESHITKEEGEKKINDERNQFNQDFANRSTLDGYITDLNSSVHETKKTSHLKTKYDGYQSEIHVGNQQRTPVSMISDSGSVKKHKSKKYFENSVSPRGDESIDSKYRTIDKGNEKSFGDKIFVNDCQNENKKCKKRKSDQKIVENSSLLRNQEEMGGGSKQGIHLEKKEDGLHKKKHRDSLGLEGSPGLVRSPKQLVVDGYLTDCKYSKHKSKKKSSFKTKRDGYASDFEVNKQESTKIDEDLKKKNKLEKFSKFQEKRRNSTLDGYATDCHSSRDKSKKKSSSKLKRDGDFETSLRIPNWEEVMSNKNKHKKKNSLETSKTSIEKECSDAIGNVGHSRTQIESHKISRKRKNSHNSESNNDHCLPTKKIKVTGSSSFSESGITDNRTAFNHENERSSITREQQQLSKSFEEGDQCVRKRKRSRGVKKKKRSIKLENTLSTDNVSVDKVLTKKKNKESREQDIISPGISRKRKFSNIGKTGDSCSIPTKKSKTIPSPSHEMGTGIDVSRKNINKEDEQNISFNKEQEILQRGKPVVEDGGENRKKKHRKSRDTSFEMDKKIDEQSSKGESLKEERMSRTSSEGPPSNSCSDVPQGLKSTNSTSNRSLVAVDNISKTPKKSAEKASRRKTPKKSAEDPKQLKMLKYLSPVKKFHPTQESSLSTDNNLRQYSNDETNSNPSNEAGADKTTSNVKKMLSFPVEKDKKSEEVGEKTSKKKKKKRKGDDLLDLQQEMINRLLKSK